MFVKKSSAGYIDALEGIRRKTLAYGTKSLLTEFILEKGKILPSHSHPQEQTGYLVSGRIILSIGAEKYEVTAGDSWSIPGGTEHGAEILENSVAIEVFAPLREDYLP